MRHSGFGICIEISDQDKGRDPAGVSTSVTYGHRIVVMVRRTTTAAGSRVAAADFKARYLELMDTRILDYAKDGRVRVHNAST